MINLKLTVISSVLGLVFSLLIGMVSHVNVGYMMIRAVISAVLTGGIAAAASFVFKKFLADDAVTMAVASSSSSSTGNVVDITLKVDEDTLPDVENAPPFYISPEAIKAKKPVDVYRMAATQREQAPSGAVTSSQPASGSENEGFVPQPLVTEKTPQYSVVPDMSSLKTETADTEVKTDFSGDSAGFENLDELPDLSSVVADAVDEVQDVISDSDFATAENPSTNYSAGGAQKDVDVGNDTELMANTIRTLLNSEG